MGAPKWQTGPTWFKGLTPEEQKARMGPQKYELWKAGKIKLNDLAQVHHDATWGNSPKVATAERVGEMNGNCHRCRYWRSPDRNSVRDTGFSKWCSNSQSPAFGSATDSSYGCDAFEDKDAKAPLWMRFLVKVLGRLND